MASALCTLALAACTPTFNNPLYPLIVLGQPDFTTNLVLRRGMNYPYGVASDGTRLVVADYNNSRVLLWSAFPTTQGEAPTGVLGQPDFTSSSANQGGVSSQSLKNPIGVAIVGDKLFVADYANHRVLIWNTFPTGYRPADVVLGQPDFTSNTVNNGGISARSLNFPTGIGSDGTSLLVADSQNHRVLIWDTIPTTSYAAADRVLGQASLTVGSVNGGLGAGIANGGTLSSPMRVVVQGGKTLVADVSNCRVLVWNSALPTSGSAADVVIGQTGPTNGCVTSAPASAASLRAPGDMCLTSTGQLAVADVDHHRVLIWSSLPTTDGVAATVAVGQTSLTGEAANAGGVSAGSLNWLRAVSCAGDKLIVADTFNNRVLAWSTFPTQTGANASLVLGQQAFSSAVVNNPGTSATTMNLPASVESDGQHLVVADQVHHRVLVWNAIPRFSNTPADVVVGQADFGGGEKNTGGVTSQSLNTPSWGHVSGGKLFVADRNNHRVLIWNAIPTSNNQAADVVLGQPDFTVAVENNGGIGPSSLSFPYAVVTDGTRLFVSDYGNSRVLVWNAIPTTNFAPADVAIGQAGFTTGTANDPALGAATLKFPNGLSVDAGKLAIADTSNSRVLIYNTIPTASGTAADVVLGQPDFTSATSNNGGIGAKTLKALYHAHLAGGRLYVADAFNNRVLVWDTVPTVSYTAADRVLGQPNFTSDTLNNGGLGSTTLYTPIAVLSLPRVFAIVDYGNNRVLLNGSDQLAATRATAVWADLMSFFRRLLP